MQQLQIAAHIFGVLFALWHVEIAQKNWPESYKQKAYSVTEIRLKENAILMCVPIYFYLPKWDYNIQYSLIFVVASHGRKKVLIIIVLS